MSTISNEADYSSQEVEFQNNLLVEYLEARILHLYDKTKHATLKYQHVANQCSNDKPFCTASKKFLGILEKKYKKYQI